MRVARKSQRHLTRSLKHLNTSIYCLHARVLLAERVLKDKGIITEHTGMYEIAMVTWNIGRWLVGSMIRR